MVSRPFGESGCACQREPVSAPLPKMQQAAKWECCVRGASGPGAGHGLRTDGQVHAHQVKLLDWAARQATFAESAPEAVVQEVLDCLQSIFEY